MKKSNLEKSKFNNFIGSIYHFYRFTKNGQDYELCLEPCDYGFDIAIYERYGQKPYQLVMKKTCLSEAGYQNDPFHKTDRRPETWNHALQIAEEIMVKI